MRRPGWPLLVCGLVALGAIFGASLSGLSSRFLGLEYVDHYGTQWFYWFAEQSLVEWRSPGHTDLFFHPYGKDIYAHTGANVLDAVVAIPFRQLFGHVLGYNLFVLTGLVAAALAFRRLATEFTDDPVALAVGAVLFACSPYVLYELRDGRPTQALLITLPLFLRQAWRTGQTPGLRAPLAGGGWLALTGHIYWFYAFFGGLAALFLGLWRTVCPPPGAGPRGHVLVRYALMGGTAILLCLPVALPLVLQTAQGQDVPGLLDVQAWTWQQLTPITEQGELIGIFSWQPSWGSAGLYRVASDGTQHFLPSYPLVSWAALVAVALWCWRPGRLDRGGAVAVALPCMLLACGPLLLWGHEHVINPFWASWMLGVRFLRRLWWPSRAMAIPVIVIALCVVAVLTAVRTQGRGAQAAVALLLAGLWGHDLRQLGLAPFPTWSAAIPAGYQCLADGGDQALIELPYSWTQAHLYYQVAHGRPILGGMLENNDVFTPAESASLRTDNSYLQALLGVARLGGEPAAWTPADRQALHDLGYGYVVVQKDAYLQGGGVAQSVITARRTRLRRMQKDLLAMTGPPLYEDARVALYAPWGDALPCDPATLVPDERPGEGEVLFNTLLQVPAEATRIQPMFGDP